MKIVVQLLTDEIELCLNELEADDFVIEQETFVYFRDEIFINGIRKFIKNKYNVDFKETDKGSKAEQVENWYENQEIIIKYLKTFNKQRHKYYLFKGKIYAYRFMGWDNIANEISLFQYDIEDLVTLCNTLVGKKDIKHEIFLRKNK